MKDLTIAPQTTIKNAMEILDKTAEKVLLVVDENGVLIGTLTDGDIRRSILQGADLSGTIEGAFYSSPIFIYESDYNHEALRKIFLDHKIELIPLLDNDRRVTGFITWEKAFGEEKDCRKQPLEASVVIMAGGKGSRLEPFTRVLPKPLIPVGDKPVIEHIIDRFKAYGIQTFYLTIHHMSKIIRAYFEESPPDYTVEFVEEDKPRGTAASLRLLTGKLDRPFFVSNCDIVIETDYSDLYRFHCENQNLITLVASAKQYNIPYGVCELNGHGCLKKIKEKPGFNFLVNTGLYVLNPEVLESIPERQVFHITHLIEKIVSKNGKVGVYPVSEKAWIDVGQWGEYRQALKIIEGI